ncbi:DUF134 domain-containing protein [Reinekea sp.]|uniref:DUF134 domain-containing protein n=1 Tax=Reinekea sp. TaxID=1970455 RepID=UPI003989B300
MARRIECSAPYTCFKPNGVPLKLLERQTLAADELEAIRLVDLEGMQQIEAATEMAVSRQTLALILKSGRKKVSASLVLGQALFLEKI